MNKQQKTVAPNQLIDALIGVINGVTVESIDLESTSSVPKSVILECATEAIRQYKEALIQVFEELKL